MKLKAKVTLKAAVARQLGRTREAAAKGGEVENTPPPPSVVQMVDDVLKARAEDPGYFRPSGIGGCDRANVLFYHKAPSNPSKGIDPKFHRLLDTGTLTHKVFQGYLAEHPGIFFAPETPVVYPTLKIRGHADGVIIRRSDGYKFLLEIKTKTHDGFGKLTGPEPHHVLQASIYARLVGVAWIVLLYIDRDKNHMREYPVRAAASWNEVLARVKYLQACADKVEDPYRIEDDDLPAFDQETCDASWDFCSYSDYCFRIQGKEPRQPGGGFWR